MLNLYLTNIPTVDAIPRLDWVKPTRPGMRKYYLTNIMRTSIVWHPSSSFSTVFHVEFQPSHRQNLERFVILDCFESFRYVCSSSTHALLLTSTMIVICNHTSIAKLPITILLFLHFTNNSVYEDSVGIRSTTVTFVLIVLNSLGFPSYRNTELASRPQNKRCSPHVCDFFSTPSVWS
jgi:hypothetical protein